MKIFFHVAAMNNGWYKIYREIYDEIHRSGLYEAATDVVIGFLGSGADFNRLRGEMGSKCSLHYFGDDMSLYEFPTLDLLEKACKTSDELVLYCHTKGSSAPEHQGKRYWRKAMIKSLITNWRACMHEFRNNDLVGYNLYTPKRKSDGPIHFSGNWWWAKPEYIRKCVPIMQLKEKPKPINRGLWDVRFQCEFWLRTGPWMRVRWKSTGAVANREYHVDPIVGLDDPNKDPFDNAGLAVDKRFVINMKGQEDRLDSALKEIAQAGIRDVEIFEAIVPDNLEGCSLATKGQLGCYLSNKECIKKAYETNANALLVLEDDVEFGYGIQDLFRDAYKSIPADWDVVFVGSYEKNRGPYKQIENRVWKTGDHWGTHCYLLSKSGIKKMHEYLENNPIAWEVDMLMVHHMPNLRKYSLSPSMAFQKPFPSNTRVPKLED